MVTSISLLLLLYNTHFLKLPIFQVFGIPSNLRGLVPTLVMKSLTCKPARPLICIFILSAF